MPIEQSLWSGMHLWPALWRHKILITAIVAIGTVATALATLAITPIYTAEALINLRPNKATPIEIKEVLTIMVTDLNLARTEAERLGSEQFARAVIDRLDMWHDVELGGTEGPGENTLLEFPPPPVPSESGFGPNEHYIKKTTARTFDSFRRRFAAVYRPNTYIVGIQYSSKRPARAAEVANAAAQLYLAERRKAHSTATQEAIAWLRVREESQLRQMIASESAVEAYRTQVGLEEVNTVSRGMVTLTKDTMSYLNEQIATAKLELADAQAKLDNVKRLQQGPRAGIESLSEVLASPVMRDLRNQEAINTQAVERLSQTYGKEHPILQEAYADLGDIRDRIAVEVQRTASELSDRVQIAKDRVDALAAQLDSARGVAGKEAAAEAELNSRRRKAEADSEIYEAFLKRRKEAEMQEDSATADAEILSNAEVPTRPSSPNRPVFLAAGFTASATLGVLIVLFIERTRRWVVDPRKLEMLSGTRVWGMLPMTDHEIGTAEDWRMRSAISGIRSALVLKAEASSGRAVTVTSWRPLEGKTRLAAELALNLASAGYRCLLMDADLRSAGATRLFCLAPSPGLADVLMGGGLSDTLQIAGNGGLQFLSTGQMISDPSAALESPAMRRLLVEVRQTYDYVIIDTPPIIIGPDALAVASHADEAIVAVRWAATDEAAAILAVEQVRAVCPRTSFVLTAVDPRGYSRLDVADADRFSKRYYRYSSPPSTRPVGTAP